MKLTKGYTQIRVKDEYDRLSTQLIEGYHFNYEGIDFLVHQSHKDKNNKWTVTENITGMRVISEFKTRKQAIESFKYTMNKFGIEKVKEVIKRNIEKYNISI